MTQYLLSVHGTTEDEPAYASDEEMQAAFAAVGLFNAKLVDEGAFVFGGGLQPSDTATVVKAQGGDVVVTDGPYAETKEQIGGFWIITAPDLDVALRWAAEGSAACGQAVEVRPFQDEPES